ncbi:MAG TPA: ArsA-related P-loop ATPase [Acidimicrobiales bacterium]|nr:ArsA-related P-loop ATPase [Acidimicrobiales bacterium]
MSTRDLVREAEVIVCTGSGGVGKTTVAAVLAMEGARQGRRTAVVTIDPAKRLADALGLEGLTNEPGRIEGDWPGELSALMLDTKSTFDALVTKYAETPDQAQRILDNRFYKNISSALSATQEFMAMEKLYELHVESDFDLVVVDTPPTRNALDFLDAPGTLTRFLDHPLYKVVMAPTRGVLRVASAATQAFLRTVSRIVGSEVIDDAIAFFQAFQGMEEGFRSRARRVDELLADATTRFVLVASPRRDTLAEAVFFAEALRTAEIDISALIVNRMHPRFGEGIGEAARERATTLAGTTIGELYGNLADFQLIAGREEDHLDDLVGKVGDATVVRVPFLRSDVHDLDGLEELAAHVVT